MERRELRMRLAYENLTKITPFYGGVFSNWLGEVLTDVRIAMIGE